MNKVHIQFAQLHHVPVSKAYINVLSFKLMIAIRGLPYSKFAFGEVYRRIYGRKFSGAVKRDFRTYIRQYTSPNDNLEYGIPHSNTLMQSRLKLERCNPHKPHVFQQNGT